MAEDNVVVDYRHSSRQAKALRRSNPIVHGRRIEEPVLQIGAATLYL